MLKRRSRTPRFKRRRTGGRFASWWVLWRVPVLLLIVMAAWWFGVRPVMEEQGWVRVTQDFALCGERSSEAAGCVVDGDTLIIGFGNDRRRIRLTGFDAPELDGACQAEREAAQKARGALHDWIGEGPIEWNGADDPPYDQYGRELRAARRVARDGSREFLAETMIKRGLAAESGWGAEPKNWCSE
ncbi:hypothetical protein [uncultured Erythrobacter sp.]|uniref:thermonuclease family protein n=1 Tax=uncultured Erythrobacter sp. TaxID=263913 RepID=UPI0026130F87|nr:hypothetical protein [uncultured Erythrobacter sp.]